MKFTKEIGSILFDGYWKGGADGNPRHRQGKSEPKSFDEAIQSYPFMLGKIKSTIVMTDYDNRDAFECRLKIAKALGQHCIAIKSPNRGGHIYWGNRIQSVKVSNSGNKTILTLTPVDYKCGIKLIRSTGEVKEADNYGTLSNDDRTLREVVYCSYTESGELDEIPFYDLPIKASAAFLGLGEGDGRQEGLFTYMIPLKEAGYTYEQFREVAEIIDQYLFSANLGDEFENAVRREAWDSINISSSQFGAGNSFQHNKFAEYLIEKHHIKKINGQLHLYHDGVYVPGYDAVENAMLDEIPFLKKRQRSEVLDYLKLRCKEVEPCSFEYIAFQNGIYNLKSDTLEPFSPEIIVTNKIPHNYNVEARSEELDLFLDRISCGDEEIRDALEEAAGACLYRSNTLGGGKMIVLQGEKANGKSTYIDMLKAMLSKANYSSLDISQMKDRFSTAMLFGKTANLADDISDAYIDETSQLKKIITGNQIKAEWKGQDAFEFQPYCTIICSANEIPRTKDKTGAVQRRLHIIPMNAYFSPADEHYDPEITRKLQKEDNIEYLIQLAIDGLRCVLQNKKFTTSKKVEEALNTYERENNPVLSFIDESDVEADILNEPTDEVYRRYTVFCADNGYIAGNKTTFSKKVNRCLNTISKKARCNGKLCWIFAKA